MFIFSTNSLKAQSCNNAPHVQPQISFDWVEENGEAFVQFTTNTTNIAISIAWDAGLPTPNSYALWQGNCNTHTTLDTGSFVVTEDQSLFYSYSNLIPGYQYLFKFEGTQGSNFVLHGYIIENINPTGTNCNSDTLCNLVTNGGFEDPDNLINVGSPVGSLTNNPNNAATAFAHEACGWAPAANGTTPDYYLEPADLNYQLGCGTASDIGNSCAGFGHNNTNGVMHLFTRDLRQNIGTSNRREYIFSRLNNNIFGNSIFYVNLHVQHRGVREARCSALQILFPESTLNVLNNPVTNQQPITNWGTPQVDFSNDINIVAGTTPPWQEITQVFQFKGIESDAIVIGNFLDNATTDLNFLLPPTNNPQNNLADSIPSIFIDDVEVIELGNAGLDISMCDIIDTTIGIAAPCLHHDSITYLWINLTTAQVLGNTVPINISPNYGVNTYLLTINFRGVVFNDTVNVYVAPPTSVTTINAFACLPPNNIASFILNNVDPLLPWSISSSDLTWTNVSLDPNGLLNVDNPQISGGLGFGTFTFNGFTSIGSIHCPVSFDIKIYECCLPQQPIDYQFQPGDNMATLFQPLGLTVISGANIGITGNVTANDNYIFLDCNFYFSADSRLEFPSGFVSSISNSTLQPCNNWRWNELLVHDNATLSIDNSNMWGAIRGIELLNNSSFFAFENLFENNYNHILFSSVTNSSHDIYANDFISEPFGFANIIQTPNSNITLASMKNILTGITLVTSSNCTIGVPGQVPNRFSTTSPTHTDISNELVYIHPITSQVNIYNNRIGFAKAGIWALSQSNITVGGTANQANTFNPTFSNANPYSGIGISANESWGVIENNRFDAIGTAITFEKCGSTLNGYGATEIINNPVIDALMGINISATHKSASRIRINNNVISNANTGIHVKDYNGDGSLGGQQDKVFINNNNIQTLAPVNLFDISFGIHLEDDIAMIVGDNTISTATGYTPNGSFTYPNVMGIYVDGSESVEISNNTINRYDHGLVMDNDNGATYFSCLNFNNCRTGVLYKNLTNPIYPNVEDVRDFNTTGVANNSQSHVIFNDNGISLANLARVRVVNCNVSGHWYMGPTYVFNEDPDYGNNSNYLNIFGTPIFGIALNPSCYNLPANKTNNSIKEIELESVKVFPIPATNILFVESPQNSSFNIFDITGKKVLQGNLQENTSNEIDISSIENGIYSLIVFNKNLKHYEKIMVFHNY